MKVTDASGVDPTRTMRPTEVRNLHEELKAAKGQVEKLRKALEDIVNPMTRIRQEAANNGYTLDGYMAVLQCKDPDYLQEIARKALSE